eukprot:360667-Chlamydomonas_euryale.AAC.6
MAVWCTHTLHVCIKSGNVLWAFGTQCIHSRRTACRAWPAEKSAACQIPHADAFMRMQRDMKGGGSSMQARKCARKGSMERGWHDRGGGRMQGRQHSGPVSTHRLSPGADRTAFFKADELQFAMTLPGRGIGFRWARACLLACHAESGLRMRVLCRMNVH